MVVPNCSTVHVVPVHHVALMILDLVDLELKVSGRSLGPDWTNDLDHLAFELLNRLELVSVFE